jgi:hypothetical protein
MRWLWLSVGATVFACTGTVSGDPTDAGLVATGGGATTGGGAATGGGVATGGGTATGGGVATGGGSATGGGATTGGGSGGGVVDAGPGCFAWDGGVVGSATGQVWSLSPGTTLGSVLAGAQPGDKVVVHGGSYSAETISKAFTADVFVEAAAGETPVFHGLSLHGAAHLVLTGLHFDQVVNLNNASYVVFDQVNLVVAAGTSGLELFNSSGGPTHHVKVLRSHVEGGDRTVFLGGSFGLEATWNHDLEFRQNDFVCGTHNCFQFSGGRDAIIDDNDFHDPKGDGVLTAGAARITITRNRFRGDPTVSSSAIALATPGKEWDNYQGVDFMLTTDVVIANNLIVGWGGNGVALEALDGVKIVNNTIANCGTGLWTWARSPTGYGASGPVILVGNHHVQLWNNLISSVQRDAADPVLLLDSNNLVGTGTQFVDQVDFVPVTPGPALDTGLVNVDTPTFDRRGSPRDATPDLGAWEVGAPSCP